MKFRLLFFISILSAFSLLAQKKEEQSRVPRPKLIVGIVVDQMRWDYLYRFYDRYQENGFKRLLHDGFSCENTYIDYLPTVTAIGHSTIYTGSVPAIHGITGNDFRIFSSGEKIYCTGDNSVKTVGSTSNAGQMSPRNLLVSTIADELKLATNFRSKVIGISLKDRGSILPVGHTGDAAYWFDDRTGNWITSTYYMKELPAWVRKINESGHVEKYLRKDWNTLYPIDTYLQSFPDNNPYESLFKGTTIPTFPVMTSSMFKNDFGLIRNTPYGNSITFEMAEKAIDNEKLGKNGVTDFLAISLSSTDNIGHQFGPNSVEIEDTYLRLDKELAAFFNFLDKETGKGNYTVFLTADHGVAHNPSLLKDKNIPAGIWQGGKLLRELNTYFKEKYKAEDLILGFDNFQVHLNKQPIVELKLSEIEIRKYIVDYLKGKEGIAYAIDMDKVQETSIPDFLRNRVVNGFNPDRSGIIQIILKPGWNSYGKGAGHSAWNPYDAHIPLIWMGWGIKKGHTNKLVNMTDITPTLAALLKIQVPNGCVGKCIEDVLK